ncbi:electron transfer flavoprotein subunit beta/FixA family protein [Galactobacter valiniphilus]|uniref:electron transfer flavoprotein subunit beta/FixA family protein n=1 Tax=Galactobacter valiniphilus TaxID=2676122 RepID=UPI003734CE52
MSKSSGAPLKVLVLVKYVPDAQFPRHFGPDNRLVREESILSELDEYAVETALEISEAHGGEKVSPVTVLTIGRPEASAAVKKALQMGAASGVHVSDDAIAGSDALATSRVLEAAVRRLAPDVVVTGMSSTDAETGVLPSMLAARLGWPQLTLASGDVSVSEDATTLSARRDEDAEVLQLRATLPAVLSVTDQANEPRYPNFKSILGARKKPVQTLSLAELGLDAALVGAAGSGVSVLEAGDAPARAAGRVIVDDGQAGVALVDFLAERNLI